MTKNEGISWAVTIAIVTLMGAGVKSCYDHDAARIRQSRRQELRDCARLLGLAQTAADSVWVRFEAPTQCEGRWAWKRRAPAVPTRY